MCRLYIQAHSYSRFFEVLPGQVGNTELLVEAAVSVALADLFDEVLVDDVTIHFSLPSRTGQRDCFIHIQARCSISFSSMKDEVENAVKECMGSILKELFGPVTIDNVLIESTLIETTI